MTEISSPVPAGPTIAGEVCRPRVLLVDDDTRLVHVVSMYLAFEGFRVSSVANGEDALLEVQREPPDVIVMDIMMPGIDGIDVCARIRGDPATTSIPVVLFSALSSTADVERARMAGAQHLVTKPFNLVGLAAVVTSLCAAARVTTTGS